MTIRHFIVVGLSENTSIPYEKYQDAEFVLIKPEQYIGDLFDGTLDFSSKGAKRRMQIGYIDAVRCLEFYGEDMTSAEVRIRYDEAVRREYNQLDFEEKRLMGGLGLKQRLCPVALAPHSSSSTSS